MEGKLILRHHFYSYFSFFYLVGEEKLILTDYFILIFVGLTEELSKDYSCSSIFSDGERRAQQT